MSDFYQPFQPTLTQAGLNQLELTIKTKGPCDLLKGVVHSYLQIRAEKPTPYPVMPDATQAVYISHQGSMIGGAQTEARDIQLFQAGDYFGIWFYPGALRHFFSLDLSEISGQFVDENYFQCCSLVELHNNIYSYQQFYDRAHICERWLLDRYSLKPVAAFDYALSLIYQSYGNERIEKISSKVGWSSRHLNRQFLQHTGLTTKTFSQIIRAQHACKQLYFKSMDPLNVCLDLGYYDQSHFIKTFKKYFKSTPGGFFD